VITACGPGFILVSICLVLTAPAVRADADAAAGAAAFQKECAGCHGLDAHGGKDGEYPRLAGLPPGYLVLQIKDFRDRKRANKPMLPIFKAGRLSTDQIADLAAHLSALPVPEPGQVGVPPTNDGSGDLALGEELYVRDCALCHGLAGEGKPGTDNPPLRAQWPAYLKRQVADFRGERRGHEYREALFQETEPDELAAILAWAMQLNRQTPSAP
jgi:cytochrome c553